MYILYKTLSNKRTGCEIQGMKSNALSYTDDMVLTFCKGVQTIRPMTQTAWTIRTAGTDDTDQFDIPLSIRLDMIIVTNTTVWYW